MGIEVDGSKVGARVAGFGVGFVATIASLDVVF